MMKKHIFVIKLSSNTSTQKKSFDLPTFRKNFYLADCLKLSRYYKGEFHYWHMETEDYEKCKSEEVISPKRMKILERITDDRLKPVVERIKAYGTAGYQEMLMEETK